MANGVFKVLSLIWKSGAEIYRDKTDGRLAIDNAELIDPTVLKAAEPIFNDIDEWYKSTEGESAEDTTIRRALFLYCGWQANERMDTWLSNDSDSLFLLNDWTIELARSGWVDLYSDYREFENDKSSELKREFYKRAVEYVERNGD